MKVRDWLYKLGRQPAYVLAFAAIGIVAGAVLCWTGGRDKPKPRPPGQALAGGPPQAARPAQTTPSPLLVGQRLPRDETLSDAPLATSDSPQADATRYEASPGGWLVNRDIIAQIPSRKEAPEPQLKSISRVDIVEASLDDVADGIRNRLGMPLNVEVMPGQQPRTSVVMDHVTLRALLDRYATSIGALEVTKDTERSIIWKNSPLKQAANSEYTVRGLARSQALQAISNDILHTLGPDYRISIAYGGNLSPTVLQEKINLSVLGTPYEALDTLVAGTRLCWELRWQDARTAILGFVEVRKKPVRTPSLLIVGKP